MMPALLSIFQMMLLFLIPFENVPYFIIISNFQGDSTHPEWPIAEFSQLEGIPFVIKNRNFR
jgi:hypothetical protein